METKNGIGKVIGALMVSVLTGAALGVLFAPAKGRRTRKNIVNGVQDITEDFKKKIRSEAKDLHKKTGDLENLAKDKMEESSKRHN